MNFGSRDSLLSLGALMKIAVLTFDRKRLSGEFFSSYSRDRSKRCMLEIPPVLTPVLAAVFGRLQRGLESRLFLKVVPGVTKLALVFLVHSGNIFIGLTCFRSTLSLPTLTKNASVVGLHVHVTFGKEAISGCSTGNILVQSLRGSQTLLSRICWMMCEQKYIIQMVPVWREPFLVM